MSRRFIMRIRGWLGAGGVTPPPSAVQLDFRNNAQSGLLALFGM